MNYESMLKRLDLTPISQRRKPLKLITMYNIVNGTVYFPLGILCKVISLTPVTMFFNYTRPFARTNYLFSSFVPSVVSLWIAYQTMLKFPHFLFLRLMYHISMTAIHVAFCPFVTNFS